MRRNVTNRKLTQPNVGPFQRLTLPELGKFDCGAILARRLKTTRSKVVYRDQLTRTTRF